MHVIASFHSSAVGREQLSAIVADYMALERARSWRRRSVKQFGLVALLIIVGTVGLHWTAMRPQTRILSSLLPRIAVPGARSAPSKYSRPAKGEAPQPTGYQERALGWLSARPAWFFLGLCLVLPAWSWGVELECDRRLSRRLDQVKERALYPAIPFSEAKVIKSS